MLMENPGKEGSDENKKGVQESFNNL